ncbi:aqualysin-1-like [Anneissia japonica]|uniref:aqualysin-1-like n=1 Tax=Anneissia japonica TaxID=1529436 RepID=UPI0014257BFA|nr:aqualysin-1-like [Anneissia japonica]
MCIRDRVESSTGIAGENVFEDIVTKYGGRILRRYKHIFKGVSLELKSKALDKIRRLAIVDFIEEDGVATIDSVASWGLDRIDQEQLPIDGVYQHNLGDGKNVHVYILDTGLNAAHEDFEGRASITTEMDMYGGTGDDCQGHGTHCAGTVGSKTYGVAPGVQLYGVRVLKCNGAGSYSVIMQGMDWVAKNHQSPAVASISIGGSYSRLMNEAANALVKAGVTVVVAAGNDNTDACNRSPASSGDVITVAASNKNDNKPTWSNYGECVNIFAPGAGIPSTYIGSTTAMKTSSGTSMATPHVAGVAALILGQDSTLTPADVKSRIEDAATKDMLVDLDSAQKSPNLLLCIPKDKPTPLPKINIL